MDYELIKELKDAGFPQKPKEEYPLYLVERNKEPVQIPTLPELIEACGEDLWTMKKGYFMGKKGWFAGQDKDGVDNPNYWHIFSFAKDLDIAVAKLWLKLNG